MKPTLNEKFLAYLALFSGLFLSLVAEYYSILGLTSIFSAAVIPVVIMGIALGLGKISATLWLKQNWNIAPWSMRAYLFTAIMVLMIVTSMGIFGFLSKAHSDQSLVGGDVQSKIAIYDEKIKTSKDNIDANRKALKQMDEAVDQVMARSSSETGADKAVGIRRSQQKERARLQSEIQTEQKTIATLSEERAPIAAEVRKVEAEVGPIKYIAAFVYGETDQTILEKAVTWVIIILIVVFDPLAVILLLSSQISFQNFREREEPKSINDFVKQPQTLVVEEENTSDYEPDDSPLTAEQIEQIKESVDPHPPGWMFSKSILEQHPYLNQPFAHFKNLEPMVYKPEVASTSTYQLFPALQEELNKADESLFVQNEEQKESNLWTKTVETISQEEYQAEAISRQELTLNEWISKIRSKEISMADVPAHILLEVRARI